MLDEGRHELPGVALGLEVRGDQADARAEDLGRAVRPVDLRELEVPIALDLVQPRVRQRHPGRQAPGVDDGGIRLRAEEPPTRGILEARPPQRDRLQAGVDVG